MLTCLVLFQLEESYCDEEVAENFESDKTILKSQDIKIIQESSTSDKEEKNINEGKLKDNLRQLPGSVG
jgi:hypothetical protein